jgi:uncharacterized protein (TIGR04255 family)
MHLGLFWERVRDRYPDVSEHVPIETKFETFGAPQPQDATRLRLLVEDISAVPTRIWFEQKGKPDLLQLQRDRILHNWRARDGEGEYPHYEVVRERFSREVAEFQEFISSEKIGEVRPNQCEVTYINIIELPDGSDVHRSLGRITPIWLQAAASLEMIGAATENAQASLRYIFADDAGLPQGRLYITFQPGYRTKDKLPVYRVELTARGKPNEETTESAFQLLDKGRRLIVQSFDKITDTKMHEVWGRKNGASLT